MNLPGLLGIGLQLYLAFNSSKVMGAHSQCDDTCVGQTVSRWSKAAGFRHLIS
jgi:hypothetical protein